MADIRIIVCDIEQYDGDWPTPEYPTLLLDAIAWFQAKLQQIPEEYRAQARCTIGSTSSYDNHYGHIEISYDRPETAAECSKRLVEEEAHVALLRARDLKTLRTLLAKYPGS